MIFFTARNLINITAEKLHTVCLDLAPHSPLRDLYQSFVCGASLADPALSSAFTQAGLIHVVVVSGAHLVFLEVLLRSMDPQSRITLPFLGFYSLVTGFEAPIARSLIQILLQKFSQKFQLHWPPPLLTLGAGLLTLAWLGSSLSLALSWLASLALQASGSSPLKTQLRIYLCLWPILASIGPAHPLSIVINVVFVPLLSALAFPMSLICFLVPKFTTLMDPIWQGFHQLLNYIGVEISLHSSAFLNEGRWVGAYVVLLQAASLLHHTWTLQNNAVPTKRPTF